MRDKELNLYRKNIAQAIGVDPGVDFDMWLFTIFRTWLGEDFSIADVLNLKDALMPHILGVIGARENLEKILSTVILVILHMAPSISDACKDRKVNLDKLDHESIAEYLSDEPEAIMNELFREAFF